MSEPQPTKIKHRPLLDGTRGVMMCVVLGYHLDGATKLPGAWVSMDFFFVLSGYLITTLLVKERAETGRIDLRVFFRRRVRRLGPALLAVLAGVFAAAGVLGGAEAFPDLRRDGLATSFYVANWNFIWSSQSYFAAFDLSPLRHAWSLAIEEQFYVVWPLVFIVLARLARSDRRRMVAVLVLALAASAWWMRHLSLGDVDLSRAYYGTDTRGQGLLVGSIMALVLWRDRWDSPRAKVVAGWLGTAALGGLVAMMLLFTDHSRAVYTRGGFLLITVTSAVFVFGCARAERGPLAWIFGNRVSRHMGMLSYSFYLWHWPVIVMLDGERSGLGGAWLDLARVAVALALAEVTYWFLERPIHQQRWQLRRQGRVLGPAFAAVVVLLLVVTSGPVTERPPDTGGGQSASGAPVATAGGRVLVVGDSLAWLLAGNAPEDFPYAVEGVFQAHCDIIGDRIYTGDTLERADPSCHQWPDRWADGLAGRIDGVVGDPDLVVVSGGLRQLFDLDIDGTRVPVGSPRWEAAYRAALERAVAVLRSGTDAPVLWLDVPCYRWGAAGTAGEEADAARLAEVNRVLDDVLADHPGFTVVDYAERVCDGPDGVEPRDDLRPDGAHLTVEAAHDFWRWLQPTIARATT